MYKNFYQMNFALKHLCNIPRAKTIEQSASFLMDGVQPFGISKYAAWIAADLNEPGQGSQMISNWPGAWTKAYMREKRYLYDPIVTRAIAKTGSFFWHEVDGYVPPKALTLKRDACCCKGKIDGFTVSWRTSRSFATLVSFAGEQLEWNPLERATVVALAETFISKALCLRAEDGGQAIKTLTPKERRILSLAAIGDSDRTISEKLDVHRGTVLAHWSRIRSKLGANDRTQAVAIGIREGQIVF